VLIYTSLFHFAYLKIRIHKTLNYKI
jgi:hypothetical protein